MRTYVPKSYRMSNLVYLMTRATLRDYDRLLKELPQAEQAHDTERAKALRDRIVAIEYAQHAVAPEYRAAVWENIVHDTPFPAGMRRSILSDRRKLLIQTAAYTLGFM